MNPLLSPDVLRNPYPLYQMVRSSNQSVIFLEALGLWGAFGYDQVKTVLSDHARFSSGQGGGFSLITTDPPRHTQLRSLVSKAFTPKAVAALEPRIERIANELLDQVASTGRMDLIQDFAYPLPVIVIAELLGIPAEDRAQFKRWSDRVVASADVVIGGGAQGSGTAYMEMSAYFRDIIQRRRSEPLDGDLISALIHAEEENVYLSEQDILGFCILLLVAGNETTTNLIGNAVLTLLEHPEAYQALMDDPNLLSSAIEEVLRYRSPVQAMFRTTTQETELGGQKIPAGKRVIAFIGSANRDEDKFVDAQRFDIRRNPNPHIAFGHGVHFCLGAPLARLEAKIALSAVLYRLRRLARENDEPLPPAEGFIVHGYKSMPLRFEPVV